jgi:hypothetical protein
MGLDILKALKAVVDTGNNRISIGKENYTLTSDKSDEEKGDFLGKIEQGRTAYL